MAIYRIFEAKRLRNTTVGNPMWELKLIPEFGEDKTIIVCRNKPNSMFIYGMRVDGCIDGKLHTTRSGRIYLTDGKNV